jgi:hypothetical protein
VETAAMKWLLVSICVAGLLVSGSANTGAQTLEQTAAFIISGGFVDLKDLKAVAEDKVFIRGYFLAPTVMMPPLSLTVTDRKQCILQTKSMYQTQTEFMDYYFSNAILSETHDEPTDLPDMTKFYLVGEDYVVCPRDGDSGSCLRSAGLAAKTREIPTIYKAMKYIYSDFCKSARRKNAF